jgi:hypothetical protein
MTMATDVTSQFMKHIERLMYSLPLFVFIAPAIYELDAMRRPVTAPTIEVVASVTEEECWEALTDPGRVIVVIGPDAEVKPQVEPNDLFCQQSLRAIHRG